MPPLRRGSRRRSCLHALTHTKHAHVPSPTYMRAFMRTTRGHDRALDTATAPNARARHTAAHLGRPSLEEEGLVPALLGSRSGAPAGTHAGAVGTLRVMRVPPLMPGGIPATSHNLPHALWSEGGCLSCSSFPPIPRCTDWRHEWGNCGAAGVPWRRWSGVRPCLPWRRSISPLR
jgi:hypothetical protein